MPSRGHPWLLTAFIATFLAALAGMFWNQLEPRHKGVPAGTKVMMVVTVLAAVVARGVGRTPIRRTITVVGGAMPLGLLLNAMVGLARDPSSNNLWPIGVFMGAVMGFLLSATGAGLGSLVLLVVGASPRRDGSPGASPGLHERDAPRR